ncbi:hypothetical protein DDL28_08130 [Staphylococcus aureus]|uniref:Uncharacterized protein n=1 Tax=Staphylococcus aureus TaxID=1280 RepID=A0AAX2YSE3_STAAU|nr:hypothetical protein BSG38_07335 [Staphylococcus aureus]EJE55857.1 hypothetical protein Newbould305_2125 [Staphylococcus aureus subsp. aureus str. Newbould 305]EOR34178.1 hypothetical protein S091751_1455 [Staphylococcus aureus subsp. aureus 091751]POO69798.1 hypothetical protein C1T26_10605 [Bacillus amyloliquefaciens]APZ40176.1 hypothetical protein BSG37_07170 [Staphylococcus aureus]
MHNNDLLYLLQNGSGPTCIICGISYRNSLCWSPPQPAHYCKLNFHKLLCWDPRPELKKPSYKRISFG